MGDISTLRKCRLPMSIILEQKSASDKAEDLHLASRMFLINLAASTTETFVPLNKACASINSFSMVLIILLSRTFVQITLDNLENKCVKTGKSKKKNLSLKE